MELPISIRGAAPPERRLAIYLNDHLAGATAGVEVARRVASSNRAEPAFGSVLAEVRDEIEADRATLENLMEELEVGRSRVKPAAAWVGEKLGRLKPNGQVTGYSPLSRLFELEILCIGITGKIRLWEALEETLGTTVQGFDFGRLAARAEDQRGRVEELHRLAAARAFPSKT